MGNRLKEWRNEILELSDNDLIDELERPTEGWDNMVLREAIKRILKRMADR